MTDLRLAPTAVAAWITAWLLTGAVEGAPVVAVAAVAGAMTGAFALVTIRWRARRAPRDGAVTRTGARAWSRGLAAVAAQALLVLGCVAGLAMSVQLQAAGRAPTEALAADGAHAVLSGRVVSDAQAATFGAGRRWVLAADAMTARGVTSRVRARVQITSETEVAYGSRVVVDGKLAPADPGAAQAARMTASHVTVREPPATLVAATTRMRAALLDVTADLSPQAQGLVPGIAVGDTSRLLPDLADAFRATGLTHLTAVSGGHFAIVLALVTAFVGSVRAPRTVRVLLVAAVTPAFVLLVRPDPSVLRAAVMAVVMLLGIAWGRPAASIPALCATAVALLGTDPWLARSYGFALSCAATAGLVLLAPPLARRLTPWVGRGAAFALAVPLAAQAVCGPILVLLAPALPTTSVLANLLAAPAVVPATLLGLGAALTAPWWPGGAHLAAWLASVATAWIAGVARWCAALPGAAVPWPDGVRGAMVLAAATVVVLVVVLRRPPVQALPLAWADPVRRRWRSARASGRAAWTRWRRGVPSRRDRRAALVAGLLAVAVTVAMLAGTGVVLRLVPRSGPVPADWQVVACDVGQGDSLVIRTGPASAVVVDAGPDDAAGRCLDALGVTHVDLLVLSHFHADHVGGLPGVLAGRAVEAAWVSPRSAPAGQARRTRAALDGAGVDVRVPTVGDEGEAGQGGWRVTWRVLGTGIGGAGPDPTGASDELSDGGDGINDASLAVELISTSPGGVLDVVALGDLEEPGQDALLSALRSGGPPGVLDGVDVVKVAHHGSASQSRGLATLLRPRVALVSVGAQNTYGHPTDRMLGLYDDVGATVVRTDECGTAVLAVRRGRIGLSCA